MAAWLADLPQKWLLRGGGGQLVPGIVGFEPMAGPPITRPMKAKRHKIIPVQQLYRDAQLDLLEAFIEAHALGTPAGLSGGSAAFTWTNPDSRGKIYTFKLVPQSITWNVELPGQNPHPDATGSPIGGAFAIADPTNVPQRTLIVAFSLIQADYFVP